ncbi:MAG: hypothetical protein EXX96DRAFT_25290 [Benjaminiella poitrasii]|nr:MAG: hypothetical protein EXX96DRAFT_25290 [Benjaminiella poitrasii]
MISIRTPGGSQVSNRFWKEIHGLTARKESASPGRVSKRSAPLIKRFTQRANEEKPMTPTRRSTWNNDDDDFWSTGSGEDTIANSFHTRLFRAAQEEREYPEQQSIQVNNSFVNKSLFGKNEEEEDEGEEEEEEHTVHSLFNNKLFKAAQQAYNNEKQQILRKPRKSTTLSEEIATAEKRDNIIKRNNIPTMNANVLAELKAKYQQKLIDDSDAYKFS